MLRRLASIFLVLVFAATIALAQKKQQTERTVQGVVSDASGPVAGAVVQLKNLKTLQVRSFITRDKGDYYFHGLSMDVDFELKAQSNGRESNSRTVSNFDSHPEVTVNLQLK